MPLFNFLGSSKYVTDSSRFAQRVGDVNTAQAFDFIIIGGGTAGCVLASRLSENPNFRVLVLEAGGSGKNLIFTRIPSAFTLLFHTKHIYELHTEKQASAHNRSVYWPRGKMLGGCSSVNAEMAQYGAPGDFDEWARITGDDSWAWANFQHYFRKIEKYVPNPTYAKEINAAAKGSDGPVKVGYFTSLHPQCEDFVTTCTNVDIPFSSDFNTSSGTRGVSRIMTYVDDQGERVSSESAYFTKEVLARPNLVVALYAQVTRILFDTKAEGTPRAIGIEFARSENSPQYRAYAQKEVILSAGAIHSPHILLLSGIGDTGHLRDVKVDVVHDLPSVGSRLVDHPVMDLAFKDRGTTPKYIRPNSLLEAFKFLSAGFLYLTTRTGALSTNVAEAAAFVRSDDPKLFPPDEYPEKIKDTTSAKDSPDLELFSTICGYKDHGRYMYPHHTVGLHVTLLRPASAGTLRLKSSNPWDNPLMDPRYLAESEDIQKLVRGVRLLFKISKAEPLASRIDHSNTDPILDHGLLQKSDEELAEVIRERLSTLYHPAGTCRMAPRQDGGVVDSELRVYGVQGLRVCDASVYPTIVSGHTAGAVFAMAEKLSDILKNQHGSPVKA
ncbi:Alcohol dehydrogenase [acceptor] [Termitomyces sp. T112]|nr:Alcohol dehydrogenase [acceptor] [Termitomyces sp. T112]